MADTSGTEDLDPELTGNPDPDAPAVLDEGAEAPTDAAQNGNGDRGYMTVTEEYEYDDKDRMVKKTTTTRYFGNV